MSPPTVTLSTSVVVNRCFGGFRLSDKAAHELAELKGVPLVRKDGFLVIDTPDDWNGRMIEDVVARNDPDLVNVVCNGGASAGGSDLQIQIVHVEIEFEDNDGYENINVARVRHPQWSDRESS